jgi:hypothetical protein
MKNTADELYEAWMKESDQEASEMLYSVYLHALREPIDEDIDDEDDFDPLRIALDDEDDEDEDDDDDDFDDAFEHLPIGRKTS